MNVKTDKPILIIPVGAPGSGKNHWINSLNQKLIDEGFERNKLISVIEMDTIRKSLPRIEKEDEPSQLYNRAVAFLAKEALQVNMDYRKTVAYNATNLKPEYIDSLLSVARDKGYEPVFVTFDVPLDVLKERNITRPKEDHVPEKIIENMYKQYQSLLDSAYWRKIQQKYTVVKEEEFQFLEAKTHEFKGDVYVFGDIHGNYEALDNFFKEHPISNENTYIFVGDYLDRGTEKGIVDMYEFLKEHINDENFYFLEGNHEQWLRFWTEDLFIKYRGFKDTKKVLEENGFTKEETKEILNNMSDRIFFKIKDKEYYVVHGGFLKELDKKMALIMDGSYLMRGEKDPESKTLYETPISDKYKGEMRQIHGHRSDDGFSEKAVKSTGKENDIDITAHNNTISLVDREAVDDNGFLRVLKISQDNEMKLFRIEGENKYHAYVKEDGTVTEEVGLETHDYQIFDNPLIRTNVLHEYDNGSMMYSVNFRKNVFFDHLWDENTEKARGLFLLVDNDKNVKVVARGYDKFFNAEEREGSGNPEMTPFEEKLAKFPKNEEVRAYRKENGFLGMVSVVNGELHFFSKSTDQSDFSKMVEENFLKSCSSPDYVKNYLEKHDLTLTVEVIDPKRDPHIIEYSEPKVVGLDLVKNQLLTKKIDYEELKEFCQNAGIEHKELLFSWPNKEAFEKDYHNNIFNQDAKVKNTEGVVIECGDSMMKVKTDFYNMWKSARKFKESLARGKGKQSTNDIEAYIKDNIEELKDLPIIEVRKEYVNHRTKQTLEEISKKMDEIICSQERSLHSYNQTK